MEEINEKFIDLEKIIASKNQHLAKLLPGFVLKYLKKIIHVDEINAAIYRNKDKIGIDFADAILKEFSVNIKAHNTENITKNGRYIIAANHPLGGLDGMALMCEVGKIRKDLLFPVNDLLMNLPQLKPLFVPINKHGKNTENHQILHDAFSSESVILYFPAGLVSRKNKGIIKDLEWKKTFITVAKKYQRDIIPTYIDGKNSNFFYNLSLIRRKLGIKANIEMLYLVDEMYKQKNKTINIIFGNPISYLTFDKKYSDKEWAEYIKNIVYTKLQY
jgi:putative hemolysin